MSLSNLIFSDDPLILFGRLAFLCGVIFVVGRAGVDIVLTYASGPADQREPILRNPNYVSLALGPTVLLLVTWALKSSGLYSYAAVLISLASIILVAALLNRRFCSFLRRPWTELDGTALAYIVAGFAFWMMLGINEHPNLRDSAIYLVQGFNLFFSRYAAEWPFYGVTFIAPFLLAEHAVSTTFALLSYGDHFAYFTYGVYFLNLLAAPIIPIGAYLLFRRFLGLWPALAAAGFFCAVILDRKIWSLRAESLAWIIGFAFLMVLADVLRAFKKDAFAGRALRLFPLLTLLFFSLTLMHPATAFIVAIFSAAYSVAFVLEQWRRAQLLSVVRLAVMSLIPLFVLLGAFAYTYSGTSLTEQAARPPAGDFDAAIQFDNAWAGDPLDTDAPRVLESPPYMSRKTIAEVTGLLPVASVFRPGFAFIPLKQFPAEAVARLESIPRYEKFAYVALLVCAFALYLSPLARAVCSRHKYLFWASLAVYAGAVLFSVYLNSQSVALFPLASIRRTFVYVACFYWIAAGLAVWDFLVNPLISFYATEAKTFPRLEAGIRRLSALLNPVTRWNRGIAVVSVACFVPAWFVYSIIDYAPWTNLNATFLARTAHRLKGDFARRSPDSQSGLEIAAARVKPIVEAMTFIRAHTSRGEWVFSNVSSSDNAFWFLSSGRYSLMEGAAIYQLYFLQKAAASRMHDFAVFTRTANPAIVSPYGVRYVLLYKQAECKLPQCYGDRILSTDLAAFANSRAFSRVFENELYVVFERVRSAQSAAIPDAVTNGDGG